MKKTAFILVAALASLLVSCSQPAAAIPQNDPATAAALMTRSATILNLSSGTISVSSNTADFTGSAFASQASAALSSGGISMTITYANASCSDAAGNSYIVNGNLNYAYVLDSSTSTTSTSTVYIYSTDLTISGSDYSGSAPMDLSETETLTTDANSNISIAFTIVGTVAGKSVNTTMSF
ncbi:MAG TPA: hypothetical protein VMV83_09880 [Rectinemataceae bacterium]|nr:hypothetical protein [Rectinemataceae bacterium]